MAQPRTLFALLLQLPWWIAALVGVAFFGVAQLVFPPIAPFLDDFAGGGDLPQGV